MKKIAILAVFAGLFALYLSAQTASSISGHVSDPGGSVIPGAHVTVTNLDTNAVRTAQTENDGAYNFPALVVGPYKLEVQKDGFQTYVQSGIVLQQSGDQRTNESREHFAVGER
jgi:carboxypeptidase family protein